MEVKTIGVLTSGGDAPGMNAAVRSVVRSALKKGIRVIGIKNGYNGLLYNQTMEMDMRSVANILQQGGTMLYTARCLEFKEQEGVLKAKENCKKMGIDGLVVIGGDGSFRGASDLSSVGIPCVGIPGTIDNDISCSDYTIGYDTAMNTCVQMIDKLRDTCESHDRCSVVEVMGRHAGHIALNAGVACGATAIIVPELDYDINKIIEKIKLTQKMGKHHYIVLICEGITNVHELAKQIETTTDIETRATVLGHVQRGGAPTVRDRVVATEMGNYAVELLSKGIGDRVVGLKDNKVVDYDIKEGLKMTKSIDMNLYKIADEVSF